MDIIVNSLLYLLHISLKTTLIFGWNCNYIALAEELKVYKMLTGKWVLQMTNNNLRWQWHDKSILSNTFVLFDRPLASFTDNIIYIDRMAVVDVISQGDFFSWMAKLLATEEIQVQLDSEVQHSYTGWKSH